MNTEFRLQVVTQIGDIEAKETHRAHDSIPADRMYNASGVFYFSTKDTNEKVKYSLYLKPATDKTVWMMKPLEREDSLVGLIARKVLTPGYRGYFEVLEPGTQICPVGQLLRMTSLGVYPPGYRGMLSDALDEEQQYINNYLLQRGGIAGRDAIEKKVNDVVDSILRVVSELHGKPHADREVFFSGCLLDDAVAYLRPRVEQAGASFSWVVKFGTAVPASDLAMSSKEIRTAQEALAYYEKCADAKYQTVVVSSLKAMIASANQEESGIQRPYVRPVQSIELVGLFQKLELLPLRPNNLETLYLSLQSNVDWEILVKIFELANQVWREKCKI